MLNLGMTEVLLFAIIALIVLGPDKLPEAARFAGHWYGKLKRMVSNVQNDIDRELRMSELKAQMQQELDRIKQLEAKMQAQMLQMDKDHVSAPSQPITPKDQTTQSIFQLCHSPQLKTPFIHPTTASFNPTHLKKAV